jgi:hypothetical protein
MNKLIKMGFTEEEIKEMDIEEIQEIMQEIQDRDTR